MIIEQMDLDRSIRGELVPKRRGVFETGIDKLNGRVGNGRIRGRDSCNRCNRAAKKEEPKEPGTDDDHGAELSEQKGKLKP